jgi:hypothetical protein
MYKLYCAFPGCGKSTIYRNPSKYRFYPLKTIPGEVTPLPVSAFRMGYNPLFDSDSSLFDKNDFPGNYIEHIKRHINYFSLGNGELTMFISSHDSVRTALKEADLKYTLVYPDRSLKTEWLERYKERGSPSSFIELLDKNWDNFIDSCESDDGCNDRIVLQSGQGLSDVIKTSL